MQKLLSCLDKTFFICLILCQNYAKENEVEYYETLINQTIASIDNYHKPNSSHYFVKNYTEKSALYYGTFDFVIVGAGSAGSVIASRLSERHAYKILLLEAGEKATDFTDIPILSSVLKLTKYDWGYKTVPQTSACFAQQNHQCPFPLGKGLGGSSIINGIKYVRGNKKDYDTWAELGNEGWSYKDVLPYFKKSEHSTIPKEDVGYHGYFGELNIEWDGSLNPLTDAFLDVNLLFFNSCSA